MGIKRIILCAAFFFFALTFSANAEYVLNHDFSAGSASWSSTSPWGSYFYNEGGDDIWSGGGWGDGFEGSGWNNASIWQDSGSLFAADTKYHMSVQWRDPSDGGLDIESIQLVIIDVTDDWVDVASQYEHGLAEIGVWTTSTLIFDTSTNPSVVGHNIGVGVRVTSSTGAWVHINSVSLISSNAFNPSPANDSNTEDDMDEVGTPNGETVYVALSWDTALDPADWLSPNPNITAHYVYVQETEPNLGITVTPITVIASSPVEANASAIATGLSYNTAYYWWVEEGVDGKPAGDPCNIAGAAWMFETIREIPVVTDQPDDVIVVVNGTAVFEVTATSPSAVNYQWYISGNTLQDPQSDTAVGTDSSTLTLASIPVTDGGKYIYCVMDNGAGVSNTASALLEVERQMGSWSFDSHTYDSSVNTWHGTLNDPNTAKPAPAAIYSAGIINNAMQFNADRVVTIDGGDDAFNNFHLGITISAWVKTSETSDWMIIASKEDRASSPNYGWALNVAWDGKGDFVIDGVGNAYGEIDIDDDQWHLITGTYDGSTMRLYVDGVLDAESAVTGVAGLPTASPLVIGGILSGDYPYSGLLDDVQVYNYARAYTDVVDYYNDYSATPIPDGSLCISEMYSVAFDVSGPAGEPDCKVDLYDFAEFAAAWATSGSYPKAQ